MLGKLKPQLKFRHSSIYQLRSMITSHAVIIKQHGDPQDVLATHKYEIDDDKIKPNSVIVKVLSSPVNPSDINQIEGVYPSQPPKTTDLGTEFPTFVCGNEGLFEVIKVGSNVSNLVPGDWTIPLRVNLGTWRTYGEFEQDKLFKIPKSSQLSLIQASTLLVNPLSAYLMLTHFLKLQKGDWFIQNGGNSAVGKYASQIGKILGFKSISVIRDRVDLTEVKTDLIENCGATKVITEDDNNSKEFGGIIKNWLKEEGGSLKLALNCVGGKSSTGIARKLQNDGLMLTYGGMSYQPVILPTSIHLFKNITSAGFWSTQIVEKDPQLKQAVLNQLIKWYEQGLLKEAPVHQNKFESGDLSDTFKLAIKNAKLGKQIVTY